MYRSLIIAASLLAFASVPALAATPAAPASQPMGVSSANSTVAPSHSLKKHKIVKKSAAHSQKHKAKAQTMAPKTAE